LWTEESTAPPGTRNEHTGNLVTHFTVLGAGRIGTALAGMATESTLVRRGEPLPRHTGPIVVCTRNDDLPEVVSLVPAGRHRDLVFVQNGLLGAWLKSQELEESTQALLYFAVPTIGAPPEDGGGTVVCGPWADAFCGLLAAGGLACTSVGPTAYNGSAAVKFLWICVLGVICDRFGCTVGEAVSERHAEVAALAEELSSIVCSELGIGRIEDLPKELADYSMTIPGYRASVKEWRWRNGWIWERSQTPLHRLWLEESGRRLE
jgi:hypothetical protein